MREASWAEYLNEGQIRPFVVVYEDLVSTYEPVALKVLEYLGVAAPSDLEFAPRRLRKQADGLSEEWVRRYRERKQAHWEHKAWEDVAQS